LSTIYKATDQGSILAVACYLRSDVATSALQALETIVALKNVIIETYSKLLKSFSSVIISVMYFGVLHYCALLAIHPGLLLLLLFSLFTCVNSA